MSRSFTIDGTNVVNCVKNGNAQHVALMFSGSLFEIMGDERVSVDNGFTLHEYFNQDTNLKPGSVCSSAFNSVLLNYDGALTGFNYEREFMLMLGVERDAGTLVSASSLYPETIIIGHSTFGIKSGELYRNVNGSGTTIQNNAYRHLFAIRQSSSSSRYFVYVISESNDTKYIDEIWRVVVGESEDTVTDVSTGDTPISEYSYARLEKLAQNKICELWCFTGSGAICNQFVSINGVVRHDILFANYAHLIGKQPRRTLGKVISYNAMGVSSKLDANADAYAGTVFSSPRTLNEIRKNILNAVGLNNAYSMNGGSQTFETNPFAGMTGYTYREFLAYVGESVGKSAREQSRQITLVYTNSIPTSIEVGSRLDFNADFSHYSNEEYCFYKQDYYSYDAEEYEVMPIDVIQSKWTDTDIGVSCPLNPSGDNALIVLNNPIYNGDNATDIRARMQYAFDALTGNGSGNFTPAVMEGPSRLITEVGDVIRVYVEDDQYVWVPVYSMTTTWHGAADCVIECTGDKRLNQWDNHEFRKELREGNKVHEIIVDIEQSYSRIMDTLTGNYSTTQQTSEMISQEIGDSLGNYYTKTETAQQINTRINDALGSYSTTQQTADAISAYVTDNAYKIQSGVAINANGVEITGGKYVKITSGGLLDVDTSNLILNKDRLKFLYNNNYIDINYNNLDVFGQWGHLILSATGATQSDASTLLGGGSNGFRFILPRGYEASIDIGPYQTSDVSLFPKNSTGSTQSYGYLGKDEVNRKWKGAYIETINYTTLNQASSINTKHFIQPMPELGDLIDRLQPVTYEYNGDDSHKKRYGLIHEWTVDVMPDICVGDRYAETKDKAINYMELVPILLREIQSLRTRIKNLEQNTDKSTI